MKCFDVMKWSKHWLISFSNLTIVKYGGGNTNSLLILSIKARHSPKFQLLASTVLNISVSTLKKCCKVGAVSHVLNIMVNLIIFHELLLYPSTYPLNIKMISYFFCTNFPDHLCYFLQNMFKLSKACRLFPFLTV